MTRRQLLHKLHIYTNATVRRWTDIWIMKTDEWRSHPQTGNSNFVAADDARQLHRNHVTQVLLRCADEQVVRVASGQRFQRPLPGPPVLSSSLNMPGGLLQSSSPSLYIHHPPPRLWCVSPGLLKCLNATQMRLYFRPGRSSLHLGHGGAVPGQDLHQFVPPVKRVSEPAQLARDLLGGGDLWGRQITSDRSDHTRRSL